MAKEAQPARKSYWFGKGYKDIYLTIDGAWARNFDSIKAHFSALKENPKDTLISKAIYILIHVLAIFAIAVGGSAITLVFSLLNVLVVGIMMICVYIVFSVVWTIDRIYLLSKKVSSACPECKEHYLIPTYVCPNCGAEHTNLTSGVYGILKRRCECGEKLPSVFFNGRKHLDAICPDCKHELSDRENRLVCIPVVGGRSVGKTAFITAFSTQFIEMTAPAYGFETEIYDDSKRNIYMEIVNDYSNGTTRMTARPTDYSQVSSISFSFFVKNKKLSPDRLFHIYDIAGEVFTNNDENEIQRQYEYCQGIVLILDPFSIPEFRNEVEDKMSAVDISGIGEADMNDIIDTFINKLRQVTGLSDNKMSHVPIAVVINKMDCAGLESVIGDSAINEIMAANPDVLGNYFDAQDYLCRKFLNEYGMQGFLKNITDLFDKNRFFACSAIGHERDSGEYAPVGVMAPVEWIIKKSDPKMGSVWNENTFSKKPPEPQSVVIQ